MHDIVLSYVQSLLWLCKKFSNLLALDRAASEGSLMIPSCCRQNLVVIPIHSSLSKGPL